jgi:hypothetical protein
MQSEFALATEFVLHLGQEVISDTATQATMPLVVRPYVRYVGKFNSKSGLKDTDNLGLGVRADLFEVMLFDTVSNKLSLRGEWLTDSVADSQIAAGELVWTPHFRGALRKFLPLGETIPLSPADDGPYMSLDLSGRYRYGEVFDAGRSATLITAGEYSRLGGRARIDLGFGGNDLFSGITLFADYLYFHNLADRTGIDGFFKFEAGISYAITETVGLSFGYVLGRDEDKLQPLGRIEANLTVKFGDPKWSSVFSK